MSDNVRVALYSNNSKEQEDGELTLAEMTQNIAERDNSFLAELIERTEEGEALLRTTR